MTWNTELEGFDTKAEAEAVAAQIEGSCVLGLMEGCWDEEAGDDAEAWEVTNDSGDWIVFPADEADADPELQEDQPLPAGFVWVYAR